jgi:hypothetical protein
MPHRRAKKKRRALNSVRKLFFKEGIDTIYKAMLQAAADLKSFF